MMSKDMPEIRFKSFTNAWELRKFNSIVNRISTQSNVDYLPKIEFEDIISGEGQLNKDISNKFDGRKGIYFEPNNILYGKLRPYLKNWLFADFKGIALGDFWVFEANNSSPIFDYYLIQNEKYQEVANLSTGTKMPRSDWKTVSETRFFIPMEILEQTAIGNFFRTLDDLLTLHKRKLEGLKELKRGYLQQMFPQKGERIPRVRFDGGTGDWKEYKLSEMTDYMNGKGHEDKQSESGRYELVNLNSISIDGGLKHSGKFIDNAVETLIENDLVMILSDVGHGNLLGRVALIPENNKFVLNQRVALLRVKKSVNPYFLFSFINVNQQYFKLHGAGMSQLNISKSSVENFPSFVPTLLEQTSIGNFFRNLDNQISAQNKKLNQLKKLKSAYLQKMFI